MVELIFRKVSSIEARLAYAFLHKLIVYSKKLHHPLFMEFFIAGVIRLTTEKPQA